MGERTHAWVRHRLLTELPRPLVGTLELELRAGIDVTVCQKWSGHKRLSVFLDVYQGVMAGREAAGVRSLERLLLDGDGAGVE